MTVHCELKFTERLRGPKPVVAAGAYDALSARLVELAGFDAVWLSSLGMSTSAKALPDIGLLTASESLQIARNILPRIRLPLIVDGEDGYGDANNVRHTVMELERAGVAAISIDDNEHPKRNSFYLQSRSLVSLTAMASKIKSAAAARASEEFTVIARTEAMVAQQGVAEALDRASACVQAGADALVVHSKHWDEIRRFMDGWRGSSVPLVVIPTAFPHVTLDELLATGFNAVIYANESLRASVKAMRSVLSALRRGDDRSSVNQDLATLNDLEGIVGLEDFSL